VSELLALTKGSHHIGLTVSKLEESAKFFVEALGWQEVRRDIDYPAIFVSDGFLMVTLWETKTISPVPFNKNENIGLHHFALLVEDLECLETIYSRVIKYGMKIEFPPEPLRNSKVMHMMCYEPSGIRVEFICIPKKSNKTN